METRKGYVYVMMNPSYNDMVKIGKTTKTPEERAKELSSSTGVATPFVVVYKRSFNNCHAAEKIAHDILTERGYRVNDMREFFSVETSEAIDIILQIPDEEYPEYINESSASSEGLGANVFSSEGNELGEAYYNKAEEYYYGRNGQFEDEDMALFYYEKSAALGYTNAYEKLGDIYESRENTKKAIFYYTKAVDSYNSGCYAKLGRIYMNEYGRSYNPQNAVLAWSKYFEYLERQKDSLLTASEFSAFTVGITLISYFNNYLMHESIPEEHEDFIIKNKTGLILLFRSVVGFLENMGEADFLLERAKNDILPYLCGLPDIDNDEEELLEIEDVHDYYFGRNGKVKNVEKALMLYKKQVDKGNITGDVYAGICHYNCGRVNQTDEAWKGYYNHVYDLFDTEGKNPITPESSKVLVDAFHYMFDFAVRIEKTDLIHDYYILAALKLGYLEYVTEKMEETSKRFDAMAEAMINLKDVLAEAPAQLMAIAGVPEKIKYVEESYNAIQAERDNLVNTYTFVRGRIGEFQGRYGNSELMMYRLED